MASVSAREARARLSAGNVRYQQDKDDHPNNTVERRSQLTGGQTPFASILTCSDSRVAPELVFDQGLGDLFVIRVAGNICDDAVMGSLEYASLHLGVKLIVVMGHQSCGAVGAAVENVDVSGPATHSHIDSLIESIRPAVKAASSAGDLVEASVRENARMIAAAISGSTPVMTKLTQEGVEVIPAYYALDTGAVEWL